MISISHLTQDGIDVDIFLSQLSQTERIVIQDKNDSLNYQTWVINGTPVNVNPGTSNSYWQYPVALLNSSGSGTSNFSNNHELFLALVNGAQGPTGATGVTGGTGPTGATGATGPVSESRVYALSKRFTPFLGTIAAGTGNIANVISLIPFEVKRSGSVAEMSARVGTALASSLFQLAVYAMNSNGDPTGTPIGSTASMSGAAAVLVSDTLATSFNLFANTPYFLAVNVSTGTTLTFAALSLNSTYPMTVCGPASVASINTGGACFNYSITGQTFGTWPDLTGATLTTSIVSKVPIVFFRYGAFV